MTKRRIAGVAVRFRPVPSCWLAVLVCVGLGIAAGARADSFEPNDDPNHAHTLTNGVELESWIGAPGDEDWYRFTVSGTGTASMSLTSLPADYDLELYRLDPETQFLEWWASSENSGTSDESLSGTIEEAGTFFLRVYGYDGAFHASDSYFLQATWPGGGAQPPVVTLTAPNGGESWEAGSTHTISWSATDPDTPPENLTIDLEYSTDGGSTWAAIAADRPNAGAYWWTVPGTPTTQARVRVTASDGALQAQDVSDADFTIVAPAGNNLLAVGTGSAAPGGEGAVAVSLENEDVVKALQADVRFDPSVVEFVSGEAAGRASAFTFSASVAGTDTVRFVLYTAGAEVLAAGTGPVASLTFRAIGAAGAQTALTPGGAILSDPQGQALSLTTQAGSFTVTAGPAQPPVVTVTAPNGGEDWAAGSTQTIAWTATDPDTPSGNLTIALDYSTNGGAAWTSIATGRPNSGSYAWSVPELATTQGRVRVTASDGTGQGQDVSDANFTISQGLPADAVLTAGSGSGAAGSDVAVPLGLANPAAVKALQTDVQYDPAVLSFVSAAATGRGAAMTLSAANLGNRVRLVLYFADATILPAGTGPVANLTFTLVGAGGTQSALTPAATVLSDPDGNPLPVTNQAGSIAVTPGSAQPPVVTVTAPNGGESWPAGSTRSITWTATDPDTPSGNLVIALDYSTNGGGTWTSIATGRPNSGSYAWTVPDVATAQGRVRVTASDGALQGSDASNANFTITRDGPGGPRISIAALKNPGRVRTLHVYVSSDVALDAPPAVTVGTANVPVTLLDPVHHVYSGIIHLPNGAANASISATGASGGETGSAQAVVNF